MIRWIYHCNSFTDKKYYLYLLFTIIINLKSFENLRIMNDYLYFIFYEACMTLNLLENNKKWMDYFTEVLFFLNGKIFCILMILILTHKFISDLSTLRE